MSEPKEGFVPNPVFAGLVGICPLIAVSKSLAEGIVYGLGAALSALILGAVIPPLRGVVADRLQAPVNLALSTALAISYGFCAALYSPSIAASLWIYLPLLAVSGLSLTTLRRSSAPGRFGPDGQSRFGTIVVEAILFLLTAAFISALREIIGLGTLTFPTPGLEPSRLILTDYAPSRIFISPAGGFILLGFLVAGYRWILRIGGRKGL
jgi:Na+-translocating ferredoxin:NAD+ oxidoreductase subunit E